MIWQALADRVLAGGTVSREEALRVLRAGEDEWPGVVGAAYRIRRKHFGRTVKLNMLLNIKSGLCPEDCGYCSQSRNSTAPIEKYPLLPAGMVLEGAGRARTARASRLCLVASGRGPTDQELEHVAHTVEALKSEDPGLEICCCLGLLTEAQAGRLKAAGAWAVNHNINTSERHYEDICSTHGFEDRVRTVEAVKAAGLSPCCGVLFGMGETDEDRVDAAFRLRELGAESIPVNFLMPIPGTPLEAGAPAPSPQQCLMMLAMMRFVNPSAELRMAGGRELRLRWLQPMGLLIANSLFVGDYLTTRGQEASEDLAMIRDLGLTILGEEGAPGAPEASARPGWQVVLK